MPAVPEVPAVPAHDEVPEVPGVPAHGVPELKTILVGEQFTLERLTKGYDQSDPGTDHVCK